MISRSGFSLGAAFQHGPVKRPPKSEGVWKGPLPRYVRCCPPRARLHTPHVLAPSAAAPRARRAQNSEPPARRAPPGRRRTLP